MGYNGPLRFQHYLLRVDSSGGFLGAVASVELSFFTSPSATHSSGKRCSTFKRPVRNRVRKAMPFFLTVSSGIRHDTTRHAGQKKISESSELFVKKQAFRSPIRSFPEHRLSPAAGRQSRRRASCILADWGPLSLRRPGPHRWSSYRRQLAGPSSGVAAAEPEAGRRRARLLSGAAPQATPTGRPSPGQTADLRHLCPQHSMVIFSAQQRP